MFDRDAPLTRRQRTVIARWVAMWLGDGGISTPDDLTVNPLDDALRTLAELITLAPWRIGELALHATCVASVTTMPSCSMRSPWRRRRAFSRITVALALGRDRA